MSGYAISPPPADTGSVNGLYSGFTEGRFRKKIIKNSPLGLLSPFFTVRQETHLATMSLNHLAQYYLELVIASHYRPWGLKIPRCARRLLIDHFVKITSPPKSIWPTYLFYTVCGEKY